MVDGASLKKNNGKLKHENMKRKLKRKDNWTISEKIC